MKIKRIICAALAAAMAVSMCGCKIKVGTNKKYKDDYVVAQATGEGYKGKEGLQITYAEFMKEYDYYLKSQGVTDDTLEEVADSCKSRRTVIISYLINEKIILDKAKEYGTDTLSAEEMDAVEEEYNELVQEQVDYFAEQNAGTGEAETEADKQQRGNDEFDKYLADCGLTRDDLLVWQVNAALTNKTVEAAVADVTVDEAEVQAEFDKLQESVKSLYESSPYEYETGASYSSVWLPENARRIKHVLLSFDTAVTEEIRACRQNGDDEGADRIRAEKAAELEERTTEIINMLDNGADIDELIPEYSGDATGSQMNPDGYLLVPNGESFMAEFQQAAFELENVGEYKTCVTDYGVHVVLFASYAKLNTEDIDGFKDYLREQLLSTAKNQAFTELLNKWKEEYGFEQDYDALRIDNPNAEATTAATTAG